MNAKDQNHRAILQGIAHRAMLERGLLPDFSSEALAELGRLPIPKVAEDGSAEGPPGIRDMRNLLWASIDNDDSRDLDQLTVAEAMAGDKVKIYVAVADVD
jgi:exoribonuclease R